MPSIKPLQNYLQAQKHLQAQERVAAEGALETSLGSPSDNPVIKNNLDLFLDPETIMGQGILEILRVEMAKRG